MNKLKLKLKKNKGYALVTVLMVMVVLSILFIAAYTIIQANTKQIVYQENKMRAHYFARSGANLAYTAIVDEKMTDEFNNWNYKSKANAMSDTIKFEDENEEAVILAWFDDGFIYIESTTELRSSGVVSSIFLKFKKTFPEESYWLREID